MSNLIESLARGMDFYGKVLKANLSELENPFKLNYAITYDCNLSCDHCGIWQKEVEELRIEEIRKLFRKNDFFRWVSLTGGEPFIRPDIDSIARVIAEESRNLYILNIPTNGTMPGQVEQKVREIIELDIPHVIVTVSLDGPEELHDRKRGEEGTWRKAIETYEALDRLSRENRGFEVLFSYTVSHSNTGMFQETVERVDEEAGLDVGPDDFSVNFQHGSPHYYGKEREDRQEFFREAEEIAHRKSSIPGNPRQLITNITLGLTSTELEENTVPCVASEVSAFLHPDGTVYPCVILDEEIGDVREYDFDLTRMWEEEVEDTGEFGEMCGGCWLPCEANQRVMTNLPLSTWVYLKRLGKIY